MIPVALAASIGYQVALPERVEVAPDERVSVSLTIAATEGREISQEGPLRVSLRAVPDGALELPRRRYRRADAADARAAAPRFDLAVVGARVGLHTLEIDVRFWLCHGRTCRPIRARRSVQVEVRAGNSACAPGDRGTRFSQLKRHLGHAGDRTCRTTSAAGPRGRPGRGASTEHRGGRGPRDRRADLRGGERARGARQPRRGGERGRRGGAAGRALLGA